jgi:hypothetical protein
MADGAGLLIIPFPEIKPGWDIKRVVIVMKVFTVADIGVFLIISLCSHQTPIHIPSISHLEPGLTD